MQGYLKYLKNKKIDKFGFSIFQFQKNNCGHTENF